jgi:phage shock protein A
VARRKTTYGKLERDREKQAKQKAKLERRAQRAAESASYEESDTDSEPAAPVDEGKVLAEIAALQGQLAAGEITFEEFEERRDELSRSLGMGG